uniref:LuxR C-terminal-related transcriptional regulator n=1 Tax=unclassified Variovorax TaxID=663243 RepID=UPI000D34657E
MSMEADGANAEERWCATEPGAPAGLEETVRATRVFVMHADPLLALGAFTALAGIPDVCAFLDAGGNDAVLTERMDLVVTDGVRGPELASTPRSQRLAALRDARVLVLEPAAREQVVRAAFGAGVFGYVLSSAGPAELGQGVSSVSRGARYVSPALAGRIVDSLTREALTSREGDVLALVADGHSNKIIARQLGISEGTVKAHIKAIMGKLQATSRTHALSIAIARGLA